MKKFHVPFTFSDVDKLKKMQGSSKDLIRHRKKSKLQANLENSDVTLTREEYVSICIKSGIKYFIIIFLIGTITLYLLKVNRFLLYGAAIAALFSIFVMFSQLDRKSTRLNSSH